MLYFVALWIRQWKLYFYGTPFLITVIKKDIILASRTLDPSFIHFYRENINQTVTCRITHAEKAYYDKLIPGPGGGVLLKFELGTDVRPKVSTTTL